MPIEENEARERLNKSPLNSFIPSEFINLNKLKEEYKDLNKNESWDADGIEHNPLKR